jgi:hypothetical protein
LDAELCRRIASFSTGWTIAAEAVFVAGSFTCEA